VLVPLFWGVQFVVIKVGLTAFPPLFFVGLRFAAVAAILLPFVGRPTRRELGPMIAISVFFGGLNFALFFVGLGQDSPACRPSPTSSQHPSRSSSLGHFSVSGLRRASSSALLWHSGAWR
jgi:drug/metabolite transporter (DMT)-like permease